MYTRLSSNQAQAPNFTIIGIEKNKGELIELPENKRPHGTKISIDSDPSMMWL